MDVRFVDASGAQQYDGPEASSLLMREDGFVWVDVPGWDDEAEKLLLRDLGCHPLVIESCRQRNHVPASHSYPQHYFVTMHAPLLGDAGHVHLLELDLIIGAHYLVTVHGPLNPAVDSREALVETSAVLRRIGSGRFRPTSPAEVAYALGSAVARRQRALIGDVAEKLPELEQKVMASQFREPETLLERMFLIRHELVTARDGCADA